MSTIEQKLQKIENIILQKANAKADDMVFTALSTKNTFLEKVEIAVLQNKYKEINKETTKIRRTTTQHISNFEIKNKRKLLIQRDDFRNRIFENVFVKLCNFTKTPNYTNLFTSKINSINYNNLNDIDFYIKINDQILTSIIINKFNNTVSIKEVSDIQIGGFKMVNKKNSICIDETLDSKLNEQKPWFYSNSKLTIW